MLGARELIRCIDRQRSVIPRIRKPQLPGKSKALDLALLGVLIVATVSHAWLHRFASIDDAYITFRYAQNLADGLGFVFNPSERVEGTSSFLFTLLLAGLCKLGVEPPLASKLLGTSSFVAVVVVVYVFVRRSLAAPSAPIYAVLAGLLTLSFTPLAFHAMAGLETDLYTALFVSGVLGCAKRATYRSGNCDPRSEILRVGCADTAAAVRRS